MKPNATCEVEEGRGDDGLRFFASRSGLAASFGLPAADRPGTPTKGAGRSGRRDRWARGDSDGLTLRHKGTKSCGERTGNEGGTSHAEPRGSRRGADLENGSWDSVVPPFGFRFRFLSAWSVWSVGNPALFAGSAADRPGTDDVTVGPAAEPDGLTLRHKGTKNSGGRTGAEGRLWHADRSEEVSFPSGWIGSSLFVPLWLCVRHSGFLSSGPATSSPLFLCTA